MRPVVKPTISDDGSPRCVSDDGSTVSITDVPQRKKVLGAFDAEEEIHSQPQEVRLIFLTARSKFDTDLEHHYDQNANRYSCYGRRRTLVCATGTSEIGGDPNDNRDAEERNRRRWRHGG